MRAVLVGYDLMYDETGRLVPIEMNTNVGFDNANKAERDEDWQTVDNLISFISSNGISKVYLDTVNGTLNYAGRPVSYLYQRLKDSIGEKNVVTYWRTEPAESENNDSTLIIRVRFSDTAMVDSYCRDKVAFLNLIQSDESIGQKFAYREGGEIKGSIDFIDNGDYPNYVIKYRYPHYDGTHYPAFYKLNSQEELNNLVESLEEDCLIMKSYLNANNFWTDVQRFKVLRHWELITETGETIDLGTYTKVTGKVDLRENEYSDTGKLLKGRKGYLTAGWVSFHTGLTYLDSNDQVLMSDGTWKDAGQVEKGDEVLSLNIPFEGGVDISKHVGDYNISEVDLKNNSTVTVNTVEKVSKTDSFYGVVHLLFEEDEEEWWDLAQASYPVEDPEDGTVMFKEIQDFKVGDKVYLLSSSIPNEISYIKRTVSDVWVERNLLEGNSITVDGSHLLITRSPESTANYVAIMHNDPTTDNDNSGTGGNQTGSGDIDNPNGSQEHDELDNPVGGGGGHSGSGSGSGTGTGSGDSGTTSGGDSENTDGVNPWNCCWPMNKNYTKVEGQLQSSVDENAFDSWFDDGAAWSESTPPKIPNTLYSKCLEWGYEGYSVGGSSQDQFGNRVSYQDGWGQLTDLPCWTIITDIPRKVLIAHDLSPQTAAVMIPCCFTGCTNSSGGGGL